MKSISLILVSLFIFSLSAFAQDTSFAVSSDGNVGIGTSNPTAKLEVYGGHIKTSGGGKIFLGATDDVTEGGEMQFNGAGSYNYWNMDVFQNELRFFSNSTVNNQIQMFNNGGGRTDVYMQGNVGIGTLIPLAKLDVRGDIITGVDGSGGQLTLPAINSTFAGGCLNINGAASYEDWHIYPAYNYLRIFTTSSTDNSVNIFSDGDGKTHLNVEGEIQTQQTGDAHMVPIAYANVNSNGTLNTAATTSNVTLSGHATGSGNYYFTISGQNVSYLTTVCVATLTGSDGGEIGWSSSGGGATLFIGTKNSTGSATDKPFTFVVYKK